VGEGAGAEIPGGFLGLAVVVYAHMTEIHPHA
jgi:hypothetical protein